MTRKKFVFALFTNNWLGVSETFIFRQANSLLQYGDVFILTQNRKSSKILQNSTFQPDVFLAERTKRALYSGILKRKLYLGKNLYAAANSQLKIWEPILREKKPDIIHAHYGTAGLAVVGLSNKLGIPQITTFHGNDASVLVRKEVYLRSLKVLFLDSYIITVSKFIRDRLVQLGGNPNKIFCHYIGTDLSRFKYNKRKVSFGEKVRLNETIRFLQVSNFVEKKGHRYTVDAFARYLKHNSNAELILAGDGATRLDIQKQVIGLGIESKVKFLGAVGPERVSELMGSSDVFLHHSITGENGSEEGIPTVIMEAMAVGIPVVSTKHSGIPELVVDKVGGILVAERNVNEYAEALINFENLDSIEMAGKAFEMVRANFDIHKQNESLFQLYQHVIDDFNKTQK